MLVQRLSGISIWAIVALGVLGLGALSILVLRTYAVRVKWKTGSLEILPAATICGLPARDPLAVPDLGQRRFDADLERK